MNLTRKGYFVDFGTFEQIIYKILPGAVITFYTVQPRVLNSRIVKGKMPYSFADSGRFEPITSENTVVT